MDEVNLNSLLSQKKFISDLQVYLNVDKSKKLDITLSTEKENSDIYKIFVVFENKNYLVSLEITDSDEYNFIEFEDLNDVIENEKFNFDIDYWSYNITYDQLARLYESGKIIIPDMQRGFVWDDMQASRLIESILMGLPLPSLFLIKNIEEGNYLIVDGLQRLTTIHAFRYNKKLPNRSPNLAGFQLKGVNKEINNKTYDELLKERKTDKFDMGTINVIEFKQNKPDHEEAMYTLFERLNGGGTNLSPQQIRNSIYYGTFNDLLNKYSNLLNSHFSKKAILSLAPSENLLRIISIYDYVKKNHGAVLESDDVDFNNIRANILYKKLYNETANFYHLQYKILERKGDKEAIKKYKETLEKEIFKKIETALTECKNIFKENTFNKYDYKKGEFLSRFTPILLEALIVTILLNSEKNLKPQDKILNEFKNIFKPENKFDQYFSQGTGRLKNILGRIKTLEKVLYGNNTL